MSAVVDDQEYELTTEEKRILERRRLLQWAIARKEAAESFSGFVRHMMLDDEAPQDPTATMYQETGHTKLLCSVVEGLRDGTAMRTAIAIPPQHGKTIHISTFGPAWLLGTKPKLKIVVATYNEVRAEELGAQFQAVIESERFRRLFPKFGLMPGSQSKTVMRTLGGGHIYFVSLHGTVTGRSADIFIVDDPIKDEDQVQSDTFREKMWSRFFSVAYSRGNKRTRYVVLHTRWHADDLIGRLCDPEHPDHKSKYQDIASHWRYLNIPAVVYERELAGLLGLELTVPTDPTVQKAFGLKPMAALWEEDKDLPMLAQWKLGEPRTFNALAMGKPTVDEGAFFTQESLVEYDMHELPDLAELRIYGASDHAATENKKNDATMLGCVGVDKNDDIWILPDVVWERMETDKTVENLLIQFKFHKPVLWWMEDELISKSFGPFLMKRMYEERIYTVLQPVRPAKDKRMRARSIQGRMAMRKVRFPRQAPWWQNAKKEILAFPNGAHDDFVDWLAHIGQGLLHEVGAAKPKAANDNPHPVGSIQWIVAEGERMRAQKKRKAANSGW